MYMNVFKCTSIILFVFIILINFTMEIVSMKTHFNMCKFLFIAKLSKWTCFC